MTQLQRSSAVLFLPTLIALLVLSPSRAHAGSMGEALYLQYCAPCHQPDGKGIPGFFPPLAGDPLVTSEDPEKTQAFLRTVIFGYHGGLVIEGRLYSGTMPPIGYHGQLRDEELLVFLNYLRTAWGNNAKPITQAALASVKGVYRTTEDWKVLIETTDKCGVSYNASSLFRLPKNRVMAWVRTSLGPACEGDEQEKRVVEVLGEKYKDYEFNYDLYEIDCAGNTFKLKETSQRTKEGKIIHSIVRAGYAMEIPPGSLLEALRGAVCEK